MPIRDKKIDYQCSLADRKEFHIGNNLPLCFHIRGLPMAHFKGTVKWFNNAKGFGFLGRDSGPDVFVHYSSIQNDGYKTLKEGDEVEYDVIQGTQGPQADKVTRVPRHAA